jgi:hypothetical protein
MHFVTDRADVPQIKIYGSFTFHSRPFTLRRRQIFYVCDSTRISVYGTRMTRECFATFFYAVANSSFFTLHSSFNRAVANSSFFTLHSSLKETLHLIYLSISRTNLSILNKMTSKQTKVENFPRKSEANPKTYRNFVAPTWLAWRHRSRPHPRRVTAHAPYSN